MDKSKDSLARFHAHEDSFALLRRGRVWLDTVDLVWCKPERDVDVETTFAHARRILLHDDGVERQRRSACCCRRQRKANKPINTFAGLNPHNEVAVVTGVKVEFGSLLGNRSVECRRSPHNTAIDEDYDAGRGVVPELEPEA